MILLILLIALILRLIHIDQGLWLDEAIGAIGIRDFSYYGITFEFLKADNHPPLYYLTLKFWSSIFGFSELALRSLSVLFGVLTVYLTYLIGKQISNNKYIALLSSFFLATAPLHVYYSQEVRMYPMITFLAAALIYVFLKIENLKSLFGWFVFSILLSLTLAADYITIFLFPVFYFYGFFTKKNIKWFLLLTTSFILLGILFLWWLPMFLIQVEGGRVVTTLLPAWKDLAGGATLKQVILFWNKFVLGRISLENKLNYYGLIVISSLPIAISLILTLKDFRRVILIWLWFTIPVVTGFLASFFIPAFNYFRFIYLLPAFYLLITWGIFQLKKGSFRKILIALVLAINFTGLLIYYFDKDQLREDWKGAINFLEQNAKNDEIAVFEFPEAFAPARWYSTGKVQMIGATDRIFADQVKTKEKTADEISQKNGIYYFSYLKDLSDPNGIVEKTIEKNGFKKVEVKNFRNIGQISYYIKN